MKGSFKIPTDIKPTMTNYDFANQWYLNGTAYAPGSDEIIYDVANAGNFVFYPNFVQNEYTSMAYAVFDFADIDHSILRFYYDNQKENRKSDSTKVYDKIFDDDFVAYEEAP